MIWQQMLNLRGSQIWINVRLKIWSLGSDVGAGLLRNRLSSGPSRVSNQRGLFRGHAECSDRGHHWWDSKVWGIFFHSLSRRDYSWCNFAEISYNDIFSHMLEKLAIKVQVRVEVPAGTGDPTCVNNTYNVNIWVNIDRHVQVEERKRTKIIGCSMGYNTK